MSDTKWNTKKLVAGTAAVVLTLAAAGAAVAVNLDTADPVSSSPAGELTATEPIVDTTAAPPSTIYVDEVVTVPLTPAPVAPAAPAPAPAPAPAAAAGTTGASGSSSSYDDDDHDDDHEDDHDDEDDDESEHEDGADDDD